MSYTIGKEIAEALGLQNATSIEILARVDQAVSIKATLLMTAEQEGRLVKVLREFELKEKSVPAAPVDGLKRE